MRKLIIGFSMLLCLASCSSSITPEELHGEWAYVSILDVQNPAESTTAEEIADQAPTIRFTTTNDLIIMWGGKRLSHGKFRVEGKMIRYTENLPGGKTREFPFLVSELTNDELVFETTSREAARVTARRVR